MLCDDKSYHISGDLGCYADVLDLLSAECSGKSTCEYYASNVALMKANPCQSDFMPYLEVDYNCIKGNYVLQLCL